MAEVVIVRDEDAAGALVAGAIVDLIRSKPDAVLGLATGSTPLATYGALARRIRDDRIDVRSVRGFALDEYVGLPAGHPESYRAVITREVVEPLGLTPELVRVPAGDPAALEVRERFLTGVASAVRLLALTTDVDDVVIGGGLAALGDRLVDGVRRILGEWADESAFLASLDLARRVQVIPRGFPAAAVGAALVGEDPWPKS